MRRVLLLLVLVLFGAGGVAAWKYRASASTMLAAAEAGPVIPTTRVARGKIALNVRMDGELRPARQAALTAPAVGGMLRVLEVVDTGTAVEEGDAIMAFDPADQQYALEEALSQLAEAEQEIIKRRADIAAQTANDKVALLTADFDVRRAELDARVDADLIGANEFKIRQVTLDEAQKKLVQAQQDVKSRSVTNQASLQVLQEKLNRAKLTADRARQNMDNLVIKAPMAGVVVVRENQDAAGGFFFSGMTLPAYRVGDQVNSGRPVIDVFDVSKMEIRARVNEQERVNVAAGQHAVVTSNAAPGATYEATVMGVSGLGRPDRTAGPLRQFEVTLELARPDERVRPGTSVTVIVQGKTVENVLTLPRQALFEAEGKSIVFKRSAGDREFEAVPVKVLHRSESQVAVEGIDEGTEVALVDPAVVTHAPTKGKPVAAPPTPTAPGGGS